MKTKEELMIGMLASDQLEKKWTDSDLIEFGNYILKDLGVGRVISISHATYMNWLEESKKDEFLRVIRNQKIDYLLNGEQPQ